MYVIVHAMIAYKGDTMQVIHRAISKPFKGHSHYVSVALCLTGDAHANLNTNAKLVNCPQCIKLQKKLRLNNNAEQKLTIGQIGPHILNP